jgi:hypothetical protein
MIVNWIGRLTLPLLAAATLSACQPVYRDGYVRPSYAAVPSCDAYRYARPSRCYQPPVRTVRNDCAPAYRPARAAYRAARVPAPCAVDYGPRRYRYVGERAAPTCAAPAYRTSYRAYRPAYDDRPARSAYRSGYRSSCCY